MKLNAKKSESVQHSNHFFCEHQGKWDTILYNYIQTCYHSCTVSTSSTLTFQKYGKHGKGRQTVGGRQGEETGNKTIAAGFCYFGSR